MRQFFQKTLESFQAGFWGMKALFVAAPFETFVLSLIVLFQGIIPATLLYAIQSVIDWINSSASFPIGFVSLWAGMLFADIALTPVISTVRLHLNEKMLAHCNLLLMEKAHSFESLIPFENSKIYDEIQFLKNEASRRPLNFVYILTAFFKDFVSLSSILLLLSSFEWWIPLSIIVASLPHAIATLWFEKQSWDQLLFRSPESRKMAWISSLFLSDRIAKEMRVFDFGNFLLTRYKNLLRHTYLTIAKSHWSRSALFIFVSAFTVIGNIVVITSILLGAKQGKIGIGSFVIAIQSLVMIQTQLMGCISNLGMSTACLLFFKKLQIFLKSDLCLISNEKQKNYPWFLHEIKFNDVSFAYPDCRKAISNVNFTIKRGEKLAIVGENGTGKSTIVKLLLRFYDPTEGHITVDGVNLKELDLKIWRSTVSAVFQDFGQYHFTVSENVSLGDTSASQNRISHAITKSGFTPVLQRLPDGINTELGKEFNGTALSGGEWQKLAMARAFLRDADLLILDEPTASLDPQSEQEIFNKFADHIDGKTALLITHRLGSVKMADRILVFKNGRLVESGTHQELINERGEYFSLFSIQAKQYFL